MSAKHTLSEYAKPLSDLLKTYPFFEANQVLQKSHLNDVFQYLNQQERLTRTHLIGLGIVCGFEVEHTANAITISKGCGITSEGYLIKTDDLALTHFKPFAETGKPYDYAPFQKDMTNKILIDNIVELTHDKDTAQQGVIDDNLLKDKVLVLYIELRNESSRNCSPNNCDDKGSSVTAIVRTLLVPKNFQADYLKNKSLPAIPQPKTNNLPDLQLPRIDVPHTGLADTRQVLLAFLKAINELKFFDKYLEKEKITPTQFSFIQNLYDHLDDLIQAINEYKSKATDLICTCCPDSGWFPQHLILGTSNNDGTRFNTENRTIFMASPAIKDCEQAEKEAKRLKQRIELLIDKFEIQPPLKGVRITPTKMGAALSKKAIPYYYEDFRTLRKLWNYKKTLKGTDNQLLGYHAPDQNDVAPFAKEPLNYYLEPYNFLRIEGHLGQNYQAVLKSLLEQKEIYRLPIDVIALRTGNDLSIEHLSETQRKELIDKYQCHFQDLEALAKTLMAEIKCTLEKNIEVLEKTPMNDLVSQVGTIEGDMNLGQYMKNVPKQAIDPDSRVVRTYKKTITQQRLLAETFGENQNLFSFNSGRVKELQDQIQEVKKGIEEAQNIESHEKAQFDQLNQQLITVLNACRNKSLESLKETYKQRLEEVYKLQFLGHFLQKHPGIQHKAGVPLGGTFILVYHQQSDTIKNFSSIENQVRPVMGAEREWFQTPIEEGTVIADFFLPYICCSDCSPIQYEIKPTPEPPEELPKVDFSYRPVCQETTLEITPQGWEEGTILQYKIGNGELKDLETKKIVFPTSGFYDLTIQAKSDPKLTITKTVRIPEKLRITDIEREYKKEEKACIVKFRVVGGQPPYTVKGVEEIGDRQYQMSVTDNGDTIGITDANGCTIEEHFKADECLSCRDKMQTCTVEGWGINPKFQVELFEIDGTNLTIEAKSLSVANFGVFLKNLTEFLNNDYPGYFFEPNGEGKFTVISPICIPIKLVIQDQEKEVLFVFQRDGSGNVSSYALTPNGERIDLKPQCS